MANSRWYWRIALALAMAVPGLIGFGAAYVAARVADDRRPPIPFAATLEQVAQAAAAPTPAPATATINPLLQGDMVKFVFKKEPEPVPAVTFVDGTGTARTLADFKGRVVLLNLWATWCVPCRKEMPALDRLQAALGSDKFEVLALSVDRAGVDASRKFLDTTKIANLKLYVDQTAKMNGVLKVFGMPTTLLIDAEGREVGRLTGEAEWDSPEAKNLIASIVK